MREKRMEVIEAAVRTDAHGLCQELVEKFLTMYGMACLDRASVVKLLPHVKSVEMLQWLATVSNGNDLSLLLMEHVNDVNGRRTLTENMIGLLDDPSTTPTEFKKYEELLLQVMQL